ncbi:MAG: family 78 glycoside hydrolase catalytic domain [Ardenticatenaceae bacterium]|nr:family 78 glycoside hydrolase catalytic domain [Ardenticatenaceae bacterium]
MAVSTSSLSATRLRCEALTNPLAVTHPRPRLSWIVQANERNQWQSAYQILAASRPELLAQNQGDLWDSGKIASNETINIEYDGRPLAPTQRCWWKVCVWDGADRASEWSETAVFAQAISPTDWQSDWIGLDQTRDLELPPAPFEGATWIWLNHSKASQTAGIFVGMLTLPDDAVIADSQMAIAVSGRYRFFWGMEQYVVSEDERASWQRPYIRHMNERLHPGNNYFLLVAEQVGDQPPGVLFKITVQTEDGQIYTLVSDKTWQASDDIPEQLPANGNKWPPEIWYTPDRSREWPTCQVVAQYGAEPWGILYGTENHLPPPAYLRGNFTIAKPIRQATLYATALGAYDLHLNGQCVNRSYFDPGWSDYNIRLYFRAFDVTSMLQIGENALGAVLADGWYSGYIGWYHGRDTYGKHPRFRSQIHIEYEDGTTEIIGTHANWKVAVGPIKEADMLMGEVYDARDELTGWHSPGYNDANWTLVDTSVAHSPLLQPHPGPPVVALESESFIPQTISEPQLGVYIFDLGQNFAGIVRLKVQGATAGQKITMRHGERLKADGSLYTKNLRTARATDTYICRGNTEEIWSPRFTFHGFQYVEVTGLTTPPDKETITGIPLSTDTPRAGSFTCSDELANKLANNVYWSQRSNYLEVVTDCPQRDERLGWGDAAWTFLHAGALRADVQGFYTKWMVDWDDAQYPDGLFPWLAPLVITKMDVSGPGWAGSGPAWADAGVICPWTIYDLYGDRRQLAQHYPAMVRQVAWYRQTSRPDLLPPPVYKCLGDWLNYQAEIPDDVFRTIFFAYSTGLVARAAEVLGKHEDAVYYNSLREDIERVFQRTYVDENGRIPGDTQSGYALALLFDLLTKEQAGQAAQHLVDNIRAFGWRPTTGLIGTLPLMLALSKIGRNDVAYRLLHNEQFPGWNFSIKNGATTIWERWDSWTPETGFGDASMNSFNHFSLGAVYQWMVETIGGIRKDGPAYKRLVIAPEPGGHITNAQVTYDSVHGLIETAWQVHENQLELTVQIPANTTATIILPAANRNDIDENGRSLTEIADLQFIKQESGRVFLAAGSGRYQFRIQNAILRRITD